MLHAQLISSSISSPQYHLVRSTKIVELINMCLHKARMLQVGV
jgi:hypothetical protein